MSVFVLDRRKGPLVPCSETRARLLLVTGRAVVHRRYPFTTIRLKDRLGGDTQPVALTLNPVSRATGVATGGFDRVSNLTLARGACSQEKGKQALEIFLARESVLLKAILIRARAPMREAAAVNATCWALAGALRERGLPLETASGGATKKCTRVRMGAPKRHALAALCVGEVYAVAQWQQPVVAIEAAGRGSYQQKRVTAAGVRRGLGMRDKSVFGFRAGDLVCVTVPRGKKAGVHVGRVAIRSSGRFNVQTRPGVVQGIAHQDCRPLQRADGYGYTSRAVHPLISRGPELRFPPSSDRGDTTQEIR